MIPLTFVTVQIEDRTKVPMRPVAKFASCGERTYVSIKAQRALSED
jgi:hypothetical protein